MMGLLSGFMTPSMVASMVPKGALDQVVQSITGKVALEEGETRAVLMAWTDEGTGRAWGALMTMAGAQVSRTLEKAPLDDILKRISDL